MNVDGEQALGELEAEVGLLHQVVERASRRLPAQVAALRGAGDRLPGAAAAVASELAARADRIRAECEELSILLGRTSPADAPGRFPPRQARFDPARRRAVAGGDLARRDRADGLRLVISHMVESGASREEIEQTLETRFGVRDAVQALDELLGDRTSMAGRRSAFEQDSFVAPSAG